MTDGDTLSKTASLCPECLARIEARYVREDDAVFMEKACPSHGRFRTRVWQGADAFQSWSRPKIPIENRFSMTPAQQGCPFDCGLCPGHGQHTCTAVLEVTARCNLGCTFCFAGSGPAPPGPDPDTAHIRKLLLAVQKVSPGCNLQISGGEPTLRKDLPRIITLARETGFDFVQLNTNGIRLAGDPELAGRLKAAGLSSVFLQFDGLSDSIYTRLRGRPLFREKQAAVSACIENRIGVILVPTLVPGINVSQIGKILAFGLDHAPGVRGVHFQPVSWFGRIPGLPGDPDRITLPELMAEIETRTGGKIRQSDFRPSSCEHALCGFSGKFLVREDGGLSPMATFGTDCCTPVKAEQGSARTVASVARQWAAPPRLPEAQAPETEDGLARFIRQSRTRVFAVSAMAFQDAWTLDLARLQGCCIHSVAPDGRLIPFCAYNLTAANGRRLYRTP